MLLFIFNGRRIKINRSMDRCNREYFKIDCERNSSNFFDLLQDIDHGGNLLSDSLNVYTRKEKVYCN